MTLPHTASTPQPAGLRAVRMTLAGWGNTASSAADVYRVERQSELRQVMARAAGPVIARGAGRSYGDSATNAGGGVALCERLNRILDFDPATGRVRCECGVTFADLVRTFVPRGWFPAVTPGTQFVTVGGAIAADVHGKNHHRDGTFGRQTTEIGLLTPGGRSVRCTRDTDADLFAATLGGMGLTGFVTDATFDLIRIPSAHVSVQYRVLANLDEALAGLDADAERHRYSVAWIDGLSGGLSGGPAGSAALGRSVLMGGDFATPDQLPPDRRAAPFEIAARRAKTMPLNLPRAVFNRTTVKWFNSAFYRRHRDETKVVDYQTFFYPLDAIRHWNRMYGRRGFVQYQAVLPTASARAGLERLLREVAAGGAAPFLGVLKRTGEAGEGLLSFPIAGYSLALDIPYFDGAPALAARLDRVVLDHGGRVYLAKDALMSRASFEAMYPNAPAFMAVRRRVDPVGRLASDQARRMGLA